VFKNEKKLIQLSFEFKVPKKKDFGFYGFLDFLRVWIMVWTLE
jgi:hypothetical protein